MDSPNTSDEPAGPITIGLVSEGVTDHVVIENIVLGALDSQREEPEIHQIQPPPSVSGEVPPGGWTLVLDFLNRGEYVEALQHNDYLVIHIDTDCSQQSGYDVPWRDESGELTPERLVRSVRKKLESLLDEEFFAEHYDRFIFAIAVHQTECWLLPLLFSNNKSAKITGCLEAVNNARRKKNKPPLRRGEKKDYHQYDDASKPYRKNKTLQKKGVKNPSLSIFLDELRDKLNSGGNDGEPKQE